MKRDFVRLHTDIFDLIVVGGGIVGAGIARDAAMRGFKTLLVEKEDFGCGTTSRSTRLIHGGLRYLRTFQLGLVRQDLREREILMKIAGHLVNRLPFVIPISSRDPLFRYALPLGLYVYDLLALDRKVPKWRRLSDIETVKTEPALKQVQGLAGALVYHDCQAKWTERLCLENIIAAAEKGACALNHVELLGLSAAERLKGLQLRDTLTGEECVARGRLVINASGHWADLVAQTLHTSGAARLHKTKGIHLVTRKLSDNALVLFAQSDGRLFFVVPWDEYSLVGTTDTDYTGDPDTVYADTQDADYLVTELRRYFPTFSNADIHYAMAGIRPLVAEVKKGASDTSRSHRIIDHERNGMNGFMTVLGGKITAYRAIAEEAVNLCCRKTGRHIPCTTASELLPGGLEAPMLSEGPNSAEPSLEPSTVRYLISLYGSRYREVVSYVKRDSSRATAISSGQPDILAQIDHAIENESALTVSDFLLRRSGLGLRAGQGLDSLETVTSEMGKRLGWSAAEQTRQIEAYRQWAALGQKFRKP